MIRTEDAARDEQPREGRTSSLVLYDRNVVRRMLLSLGRRRFSAKYFAQLDAEFEGLCPPAYKQQVASEVAELRLAHEKRTSWELNHRYEYILNAGIPESVLRQRCSMYRERLKHLLGDCPREVLAAFDDQPAGTPLEDVRSALLGSLSEIQRLRHMRSEFERLRNRLFLVCALVGVAVVLFFMLSTRFMTVSMHVVLAGILGGYFSVLLRLGAMQFRDEYNHNYHQVDRFFYNVLVTFSLALFEGAVGAFLLYTAFLGGMLEGSIFPSFSDGMLHQATHKVSDLANALPSSPSDTAKLLVWSVAAGFCERLVPDVLNGLTKDRTSSLKSNAASGSLAAASESLASAR